ncbi:SDR family NAD(P)-dependent oxidoreductase [Alkalihalobacillus pseudalcaliphilus]|uniref:SDR family NAD(P)-dependent oxidoreductase n=1 Tax=Alkalihalobacillus pseudalcaliphilus TaxID=79884 RepID=UPI000AC09026|nr:SDR family oxidoreductase [Alkalihalobacillus pseudalcaliphilus]
MEKRVVVVTGAGQGIGLAIVKMFANRGDLVYALDINKVKLYEAVERLRKDQLEVRAIPCDIRSEEDIQIAVSQIKRETLQIDILINNAGVSKMKSLFELSLDEWNDVLHTNLTSVFLMSKAVAACMKETQTGGSIINIASTRAAMSEPNSEAYAASKGGVVSITHALAASLQNERITVNAISPGWIYFGKENDLREIDHDQHFSKRVGVGEDIASACLFLTNPDNSFINGENISIDGGMTKKMIYEH